MSFCHSDNVQITVYNAVESSLESITSFSLAPPSHVPKSGVDLPAAPSLTLVTAMTLVVVSVITAETTVPVPLVSVVTVSISVG